MKDNQSRTIKNRKHIPDYVIPLLEQEYQRGKIDGRKEGILFCRDLVNKGLNVLDDVLQLTADNDNEKQKT